MAAFGNPPLSGQRVEKPAGLFSQLMEFNQPQPKRYDMKKMNRA